jgi:regulator of sigma E protease
MIVILILSLLVILHELGHFFAAIWLKLSVEEFGVGYPPKAKKLFSWLGTEFTLNWIPFGGFVRLFGEEAPVEETKTTAKSTKTKVNFYTQPAWKRLVVILAGPLANVLVAGVIFTGIFAIGGIPISLKDQARIAQVMPDTPAAAAEIPTKYRVIGFRESDSAELVPISKISEVQQFTIAHRGQTWQMVLTGPCQADHCEENQVVKAIYLRTEAETPAGQGAMGLLFAEYELQFYPWYEMPWRGLQQGWIQTVDMTTLMLSELGKIMLSLLQGKGAGEAVAGPIGIVHQAQTSGLNQAGWQAIWGFAGMISLNLALMNLLPIPALDGGRAVLILLESVLGRSRLAKIEGYLNYGGFIALVTLLIVISASDIWRIWRP